MRLAGQAALTALTLQVACAHVPAKLADDLTYDERRTRLAAITDWSMRGRIAVTAGDDGFSGRFSWTQRADVMDLRIRGPLGAGAMAIQGSRSHLTVTARGATEPLSISDPERDLPGLLGWWVPVGSVPAWLLGIPDGAYPVATSFGEDGLVARFEQRDWEVELERYQLAEGLLIPARLELGHRDLTLNIIVDSWVVEALN